MTATATTHGTATFEPSANIWLETAITTIGRMATGTMAGAGTTITGTGTKFLSEIAVGDTIRALAVGSARVTAVNSDTSLTVAVAFPADPSGSDIRVYENLNIKIASEAGQRVNTISSNGLSVVVPSAWASNTSGVAIKIGVEIPSCWYFPWLVSGVGVDVILSTQRTKPFGITNYDTYYRRIPCAIYNNASGDIDRFEDTMGGAIRYIGWTDDSVHNFVAAGNATTATKLETTVGVPPTGSVVICRLAIFGAYFVTGSGYCIIQVGSVRGGGTVWCGALGIAPCGTTAATAGTNYSSGVPIAMQSGGGMYYITLLGGTGGLAVGILYINAMGWWEIAA